VFDRSAVERQLWSRVHDVPDWPEPGVLFRDLTPLMADGHPFGAAVDLMAVQLGRGMVDFVVGIEARGFPFAAALAYHLGAGFITLRKPGKLPRQVHSESYDLEYGSTALEVHQDAMSPGDRGSSWMTCWPPAARRARQWTWSAAPGAVVTGVAVLMDLPALGGSARVRELGVEVSTLLNGDAPVH